MDDAVPAHERASLVAAIEDNLFGPFRAFSRLPNAELVDRTSLLRHWTRLASPMFNGVSGARLGGDPAGEIAETVCAPSAASADGLDPIQALPCEVGTKSAHRRNTPPPTLELPPGGWGEVGGKEGARTQWRRPLEPCPRCHTVASAVRG